MSTLAVNAISPASGGTVTITGAALTTPALGTPASGNLANCTGLPASAVANTPAGGISATTVQAAVNELDSEKFDKSGGTISGNVGVGATLASWNTSLRALQVGYSAAIDSPTSSVNTRLMNNAYVDPGGGFKYIRDGVAQVYELDASGNQTWSYAASGLAGGAISLQAAQKLDSSGHLLPGADNTFNHGSGSYAIKQIYTNNSVIVTSDARLKTARTYTAKERAVARRCRDLGVAYQWNDAIAQKGADRARMHFGTTVQSVIAAFEAEGLDPMRYGVVCYDEWQAEVIEHPAIEAREAVPEVREVWEEREVDITIRVNGEDRPAKRTVLQLVQPAVPAQPAVQAREAYTETVREAGSRYSLRLDQLAFFIATARA